MAVTKRLTPDGMREYFDRFTKRFLRNESTDVVDVEVLGEEIGDQMEAEGARLLGITYDPKGSTLDLALEHGDARTYRPREVWVLEEDNGFIRAIEIVGEDGVKKIVRVRRLAVRTRTD